MSEKLWGGEDVEFFKEMEKVSKGEDGNERTSGLVGCFLGILILLVAAFVLMNPFGSRADQAAPTALIPTNQQLLASTPTLAPTVKNTIAPTPTAVDTSTPTTEPTKTAVATFTPQPTHTQQATFTPLPTHTALPTFTPFPTFTPLPAQPTFTPQPTFTAIPTFTPSPTPPELTTADLVQNRMIELRGKQQFLIGIMALLTIGISMIVFAIFKGRIDAFYERQLRAVIQEMLGPIYELIDPMIRSYWNIETPVEESIVLGESEPVSEVVTPPQHHLGGGSDLPEVAPVQTPDEPATPLSTGSTPVLDEETPVQTPVNSINVSINPKDIKDERLMRKICAVWKRLEKELGEKGKKISLNKFFKSKAVFSKNPVNSAITKRALLWGLQNDLVIDTPELQRAIGKGGK